MIKIGDFSKLSRISIRMLRHYDQIGLLNPAEVDGITGYRYYMEAQLLKAEQIQGLKDMGFKLTAISEILSNCKDPEQMECFLLDKRQELCNEVLNKQEKLRILDNTLQWLRKDGNFMEYHVTLKNLPERYVASVRQVIPAYDQEGMLWEILNKETESQHVQQQNPCYGMAIFHDEGFKDKDVDVEIQASVNGRYKDTEHVKFKEVPSIQIASATFQGSYESITKVNMAVARWVQDNGYEFDGASFCIYHVSPYDAKSPDDLVTEVCYPVKKKA